MIQVLPAPSGLLDNAEMQVQEIIFGHRFLSDQEPFMILLETLAISFSKPLGEVKFSDSENVHESFKYQLPHNRKMRFLLFNETSLDKVLQDDDVPDDQKWSKWKKEVNKEYQKISSPEQDEFQYLDSNFGRDIRSLKQAIDILRSQEIDVINDRRWTSRFLAVNGPHTLCTDIKEDAKGNWSIDRRFFGRGGELVYLMLNRSSLAEKIQDKINDRFFDINSPMNTLALKLSDIKQDSFSQTDIGYLPKKHSPRFDSLAEDWLAILSLDLPNTHIFEPLFRITTLHIIGYLSEQAHLVLGDQKVDPLLLDVSNGSDKQLRESAKQHLNRSRETFKRSVKKFIEDSASEDESWLQAVELDDVPGAIAAIKRLFKYEVVGQHKNVEGALTELIDKANSRTTNQPHRFVLPLIKGIGLAHARRGIGTWFALDDDLILTLVLSNVDKTIELREFLSLLYKKYSIVIGPEEARQAFDRLPIGVQSFEANMISLEKRMSKLAVTQRLSDDCAFVVNPYKLQGGEL